jgi:EAL and modified HD-GYP domain-containing signal transduction protein
MENYVELWHCGRIIKRTPALGFLGRGSTMDVFVARQPIFDRRQKVFAYELLFRDGFEDYYNSENADHTTSSVLTSSFISIGIGELTHGKTAFVNFSRQMLIDQIATAFPKNLLAVEVLEDVEVDKEVIAACKKLKRAGYTIVLGDFVFDGKHDPLIELTDIIKIDFLNSTLEKQESIRRALGNNGIKFLADKVEIRETFDQALKMGYDYFQGYFFSIPDIVSAKEIPSNKLSYLRLLRQIYQAEFNPSEIEKIIKPDVSLSFKLLKFINSAAIGLRSPVQSIKQAIVLMGLNTFKKWVAVVALTGMGDDKPEELLVNCITRARFCELMAEPLRLEGRGPDLFLMGLFSMIDALLDQPMAKVLDQLPISEDVKIGLLGKPSGFRDIHDIVVSYEQGNWQKCNENLPKLNLNKFVIPSLYRKSLEWSHQIFNN